MQIPTLIQTDPNLPQALWQAAHLHQLPVAFWRLPNSATQQVVIDFSGTILRREVDLKVLPPGFAFSPFHNPDGQQSLFIKADLHYVWEAGHLRSTSHMPAPKEQEAFWNTVSQYLANPAIHANACYGNTSETDGEELDQHRFEKLVAQGIASIQAGDMQKVVLSRAKEVILPDSADAMYTFNRLCQVHASAFVSLVSIPEVGTWMGASPEVLVSVDASQIFRTMALAGTQSYTADMNVIQASWTQKEIEEQALVSRYIVSCFKHIRLREYEEDGPKTVVAGNLMHLRTDFAADMTATGFPDLGTIMLRLLHPTSAVCGMPKEKAKNFILRYEGYNRAFFSGFLGPVNVQKESHLFVNLRCMRWGNDKAWLYAGAGITANSIPEKEWRETELKYQIMKDVLMLTAE